MAEVIKARYAGNEGGGSAAIVLARQNARLIEQNAIGRHRECRRRLAQSIRVLRMRAKAAGYREGLRRANTEEAARLLLWEQRRSRFHVDTRAECLELALQIAALILKREVEEDPDFLARQIDAALNQLNYERKVTVRCNAADAADLERCLSELGLEVRTQVVVQGALPPGNALIETAAGIVEIDWRVQFENLKDELRRSLALQN